MLRHAVGNPWDHTGGGCLVGGSDQDLRCDDSYEHTETGATLNLATTPEAHFGGLDSPPHGIPLDRPVHDMVEFVRATPGVEFGSGLDAHTAAYHNPLRTWHKWVIGVATVLVVAGVGVAVWARQPTPATAVPDEKEAVTDAIGQLGGDAHTLEIASVAYLSAYPEGPTRLDPDNPNDVPYIRAWDRIIADVQARLGRAGEDLDEAPPEDESDTTGERLQAWYESLTSAQRSEARDAAGSALWDPLRRAAESADDSASRAALGNVKRTVEAKYEASKIGAALLYKNLRGALGPEKLDEFVELMTDTAGPLPFA